MHTCPPPVEALKEWLSERATVLDSFGHLLLEEQEAAELEPASALTPYFESAHLDAREYFHAEFGIDLHPDADSVAARAGYPECLPTIARRGLFGEVLAGLVAESYEFVGAHKWSIPVFLFRYHVQVEEYLFNLVRNPQRTRQVFGRLGSDFIGLSLDDDGRVVRFIVGEAKWRRRLHPSVVEELMLGKWTEGPDGTRVRSGKGIWRDLNDQPAIPHGLLQLQRLLRSTDPEQYQEAILSLDRILAVPDAEPVPRTDYVVIAGNDVPSRERGKPVLPSGARPAEYTAGNDLQVVEVILQAGEDLIDAIYSTLWKSRGADGRA